MLLAQEHIGWHFRMDIALMDKCMLQQTAAQALTPRAFAPGLTPAAAHDSEVLRGSEARRCLADDWPPQILSLSHWCCDEARLSTGIHFVRTVRYRPSVFFE